MAYTPPAGDAADLTLVGAAAYTAPAGDAADLTFAESGGTPSVSLTLAVFPPYFPVQPEAAVFSLLAYAASITISDVSIYPPAALLALDAYAPLTDGVLVPGPPIDALGYSNEAYATTPATGCSSVTTPINPGETKSGALSTTGCLSTYQTNCYYDNYTFYAVAGTQYVINLTSDTLDTYLYLLDEAGTVLAEDDEGGEDRNSLITYTPSVSGVLTIHATVYDPGDVGSYTVALSGGTLPDITPYSLAAVQVSPTRINLSWTDLDTSVFIERKTGALGTYEVIGAVASPAGSYADTDIVAGTTYYYRIKATDGYALTASIPSLVQPNSWEIALESAIEFRHVTHLPWIMPMTSPVYPPATTLTLDVPVPGVNIHGLWSPEAMLFGWEYDSGTDTISIPLATLFELTASQANATTGDWRAVVLALVNSMWDSYVELDSPPRAMVLEYYPGYMMNVGPFTGHVKAEYQATTYLNFPDKTLADEP